MIIIITRTVIIIIIIIIIMHELVQETSVTQNLIEIRNSLKMRSSRLPICSPDYYDKCDYNEVLFTVFITSCSATL